jgi:formylglycine-generating enzyme required for sulfatase activity
MPDVMISYARADARAFANRLAEALRPHRSVWLDTSDIEGGADWLQSIQEAIASCGAFLAVRSPEGSSSFWVRSERLFALHRRKTIIPVLPSEAPDDLELISYQPVDFRGDFEAALRQLLARLAQVRAAAAPAVDRRTLEQAYLGRLLLEHSVYQDLYTPMAGVATLQPEPAAGRTHLVTLPASINPVFREFVQKQMAQPGPAAGLPGPRPVTEQREYADVLAAIESERQLVVLGDPGSGKTTTLWRIAVDCARKARSDPGQPLPVLARLGELRAGQTVEDHLLAQLGDLAPYSDDLWRQKRLALLLDGLNELPAGDRPRQVARVRALVERGRAAGMLVAVTCRELDYAGELDLGLPCRLVIAPLDPLRVHRFAGAYIKEPAGAGDELFWQIAGPEARHHWDVLRPYGVGERDFWEATAPPVKPARSDERYLFNEAWQSWRDHRDLERSLLGLARNPYMLFMLIQVFTLRSRIPPNRGQLFRWFVDYLLRERERLDADAAERLKGRLADLAFALQSQGGGTGLSRTDALGHLHDERSLYLAQSANLLTGSDELHFTHQLLQEFFAAGRLDHLMAAGEPATHFWPAETWWKRRGWEETAVLLAGLYSDDLTPVLRWLRDANPRVAAWCVLHSGAHTPPAEREALRSLWLPRLGSEDQTPSPEARAALGEALGLLNLDDRPGVGLRPDGLPDVVWCPVPAGPFSMGGDPDVEGLRWEGMTVDIPYPYWVAKYAVTYAQYEAFVARGGYRERRWWTSAGWQWKAERTAPSYWADEHWHLSNHPVVGVTWHEAYAFTHWLDETARGAPDLLPEPLRGLAGGDPSRPLIRLPLEAEREKAVRYPDGRKFAWGDDGRFAPANLGDMDPFRLRRTSPVGIYPKGAAPCGAFDLCGNVFDWCLSLYREDYAWPEVVNPEGPGRSVARGGSWLRSSNAARAAYREAVAPETVYDDQGFRLVAAVPLRAD